MTVIDPTGLAAAVAAMFVLIAVGVGKRRLGWRGRRCVTCGRPINSCTCRWL